MRTGVLHSCACLLPRTQYLHGQTLAATAMQTLGARWSGSGAYGASPRSASRSKPAARSCMAPPCRSNAGAASDPAPTEALQAVKQTIADNKVVLFSKTVCPYSKKAKQTLRQLLQRDLFTVMEVDQREDGEEVLNALAEVTGARTVPRLFIGGEFIGGGDDTMQKAGSGELEARLVEAGVLDKPSAPSAP